MGQTIGFPANAAKPNRARRAGARKRDEKQFVPHIDDVYLDQTQEYFGQTAPTTKCDYDIYLTSETLKAGVYPHNREYRFVERLLPNGDVETIYSGPNFLDSRTVIEDSRGEIICTIRANHLGNGFIEVRYFDDGSTWTEHQAPEDCDNFSYRKDSRGRITSLKLSDFTQLKFAYGGDNPVPFLFTDKDGVEWRRCQRTLVFKNAEGELLGGVPVQLVAANESGSYMHSSYGRFIVTHRNGAMEERYFPTIRDLLDQQFPVTVAVSSEAAIERAEVFACALRKQYDSASIQVAVITSEHVDGDVVDNRYVSRFY